MNLLFLGDSLMQLNDETTYPQKGWPQLVPTILKNPDEVKILDMALNGRSTKSFLDEGQFKRALDLVKEGDIAFISFGHNDEKDDPLRHTDPKTTYKQNLTYMIQELEKKGVKSILLSSITRLKYDENGVLLHSHGPYPRAMEEVANNLHIPFIPLEEITYEDVSCHDDLYNRSHYMCLEKGEYPNYPEGKEDTTHLKEAGAKWIVELLHPYFKKIEMLAEIFN